MKQKFSLIGIGALMTINLSAQIPYYAGTNGKGNTYTYFSTKFHPGYNNQIGYAEVMHGVHDKIDVLTEFLMGTGYSYQGYGAKFSILTSKYFNLGGQVMVDFDLNNSYKFSYNCNSLYMTGTIYEGFHWVSDTWWTLTKGSKPNIDQWLYLGWTVERVTPMIGAIMDLDNNCQTDLSVGAYWNAFRKVNLYAWCSNITSNLGNVRIVLGFDYKF